MKDDLSGFNHRLILNGRTGLCVSGVSDVDSFDERMIVAYTEMGELTIKGEGMKILSLSTETGDLSVEGSEISSLVYTGERSEGGFFRKLFK